MKIYELIVKWENDGWLEDSIGSYDTGKSTVGVYKSLMSAMSALSKIEPIDCLKYVYYKDNKNFIEKREFFRTEPNKDDEPGFIVSSTFCNFSTYNSPLGDDEYRVDFIIYERDLLD